MGDAFGERVGDGEEGGGECHELGERVELEGEGEGEEEEEGEEDEGVVGRDGAAREGAVFGAGDVRVDVAVGVVVDDAAGGAHEEDAGDEDDEDVGGWC